MDEPWAKNRGQKPRAGMSFLSRWSVRGGTPATNAFGA